MTEPTPAASALETLVKKLDEVHADDRYKAVWQIFAVHGMSYSGPSYEQELNAARDVLVALRAPAPPTQEERCEGRYPVPQTFPPRDEPFDVTYRCALPKDHDGPHGDRPGPIETKTTDRLEPVKAPTRQPDEGLEEARADLLYEIAMLPVADEGRERLQRVLIYLAALVRERDAARQAFCDTHQPPFRVEPGETCLVCAFMRVASENHGLVARLDVEDQSPFRFSKRLTIIKEET